MAFNADGSRVDPVNMAVPPYEEDTEEEFSGPGFPGYTEYDGDEFDEDDDEDEIPRAYPELNASSLELSAAQRVGSDEPSHAGIQRDYTQQRPFQRPSPLWFFPQTPHHLPPH